jgi:pimeloyl-ACP methyl ester carboxylesterase
MRNRGTMMALAFFAGSLLAQDDIGPPPGKLVDVGGRRLHLHCAGSGSPTVVIEAGASSFAIDFTLVQSELSRTNRVCSYDRAGHGWSDAITAAAPREGIPQELRALLQKDGIAPPYVLVGASMGGLYVRRYQIDYPQDVAGLVLLDPSHEDRAFTMYNGEGVAIAELTPEQFRSTIPTGDINLPRRAPQTGVPFDRLPPELYATRVRLDRRLIAAQPAVVTYEQRLQGATAEHANLAKLRQVSLAQQFPLGDRPVVVLSRATGASQAMWDVHAKAARISSNSRHTVVPESGHEIHLFKPDAVIQAVRDVVASYKDKTPLPKR